MTTNDTPDIIYTKVDEAPELASASLLPIIQSFASAAGLPDRSLPSSPNS